MFRWKKWSKRDERASCYDWQPHGRKNAAGNARECSGELCVRVSANARLEKAPALTAHRSSNNGSFMCNHRETRMLANALFDPDRDDLTRAEDFILNVALAPTRILRFPLNRELENIVFSKAMNLMNGN